MKIKTLLWLNAALSAILLTLILVLSYLSVSSLGQSLADSKQDANVINLAGRQRMFTQKMSKEAEQASQGNENALKSLKETRENFRKILDGLIDGDDSLGLTPPPNANIEHELTETARLWQDFDKALGTILAQNEGKTAALDYVRVNNIALLKQMNKAVEAWADYSEANVMAMLDDTRATFNVQTLFVMVSVLATLGLSILVIRRITRPLANTLSALDAYASGNLGSSITITRNDEMGHLAHSINTMASGLRTMVKAISERAETLGHSSSRLSTHSNTLASSAEELSAQSSNVATATQGLSSGMGTMSGQAEAMSQSANSIASAIEEMSASIGEVARNCARERNITQEAGKLASSAHRKMAELGDSAEAVGAVIDLINNIANQTNLLALNATIEAASAGEAGKGFAVVANEVKALSSQTASATEQISKLVHNIQSGAKESVNAINQVTETVNEVSEISHTVSAAVEEQAATISEISNTMSSVYRQIQNVATRIQESAHNTQEVSGNMDEINTVVHQTSTSALELQNESVRLSHLSNELADLVERFRAS